MTIMTSVEIKKEIEDIKLELCRLEIRAANARHKELQQYTIKELFDYICDHLISLEYDNIAVKAISAKADYIAQVLQKQITSHKSNV